MDQVYAIFLKKDVFFEGRYSFSEWRLMRGRACAFVKPHVGKLLPGQANTERANEYGRVSNLIVIDDSISRH